MACDLNTLHATAQRRPGSRNELVLPNSVRLEIVMFAADHRASGWVGDDSHLGASGGKNLRDTEQEVTSLTRANFNLKLRVFYLEERLRAMNAQAEAQGDDSDAQARAQALQDECVELRVLLEERTREVEDKNRLLGRARAAMEDMRNEVSRARETSTNQSSATESQLNSLRRQRDATYDALETLAAEVRCAMFIGFTVAFSSSDS